MITEYHRPQTLEEALTLLARPNTYPLGGGTRLNRPSVERFSVVDLQALGLNKINKSGNNLEIGATATLQALLDSPHIQADLAKTLRLETTFNLRQVATVAGTLVSADGRSPFAAVMLALDAKLTIDPRPLTTDSSSNVHRPSSIGEILPLRHEFLKGKLITKIEIPLNVKLSYESVARTPADRPIVCAALAQWPAGRTRLVIGGWGKSPTLAMDGSEASGVEASARNAAHDAGDEWASSEYRMDVAATLAKRCLELLR